MEEIFIYIIVTVILAVSFIVFLTLGIIKKKKGLIILGGISMFAAMAFVCVIAYTTVTKSIHKIAPIVKPRSGKAVYVSLFGKPIPNCIQIKNFQDRAHPFLDHTIRLHVKTCPKEMKRILQQKKYTVQLLSKQDKRKYKSTNGFYPEKLGDSIRMYRAVNKDGNSQIIASNLDSSEIYVEDRYHKKIDIKMPFPQLTEVK